MHTEIEGNKLGFEEVRVGDVVYLRTQRELSEVFMDENSRWSEGSPDSPDNPDNPLIIM